MRNVVRTSRLGSAGALALALAAVAVGLSPHTASANILSIPNYTANPGDIVTVSVQLDVSPAFTLDGYTLYLGFNPAQLTYMGNAVLGPVFNGHSEFSLSSTDPSNQSGNLTFSTTDNGSTGFSGIPLSTGGVTLLRFDMKVNSSFTSGTSPIVFRTDPLNGDSVLADNQFNEVAYVKPPTNGSIAIAAVPEPSQVVLVGLLGGLAGARFAWGRRSRRAAV